jgi:ABC-2 type transport system ATP-binding protein
VVEVRTSQPMVALRALDDVPSVEKTSLFGTSLHVSLKPGERDVEPIRRKLEQLAVRVDSLEMVSPSLEDVFMDVVERAGGAAA